MKVLITGGAGFIGSNLVKALINDPDVLTVRVIDNLMTGFKENISEFKGNPKFEFHEEDIRDYNACLKATANCTHVSHQAALGSVPRSVMDPITTNDININGSLNIFQASKVNGIKRIVFASSSSVYGDDLTLPKIENRVGNVLSPYALSKKTMEEYGRLFASLYNISIVGLRYFNVFGPHQNPKGPYAAVIPLFIDLLKMGKKAVIHGDGTQSRDFTYIDNVVYGNMLALKTEMNINSFQIYNLAMGQKTSLNQLYRLISDYSGSDQPADYGPARIGDIKHSLANIEKISKELNYKGKIGIEEGLKLTIKWLSERYEK